MDKSMKSKLLPSVNHEKRFFANNGETYSNYYELLEGLRAMDSATFYHHVNGNKNDFMNWVRDVFSDKRLAKEIAKLPWPEITAKKVEERIKSLQKFI